MGRNYFYINEKVKYEMYHDYQLIGTVDSLQELDRKLNYYKSKFPQKVLFVKRKSEADCCWHYTDENYIP